MTHAKPWKKWKKWIKLQRMQSPQNIQLKRCISVHTHKTATENIINVEGETALCFICICLYVCFKSGSEDVTNVSVRVCVCVRESVCGGCQWAVFWEFLPSCGGGSEDVTNVGELRLLFLSFPFSPHSLDVKNEGKTKKQDWKRKHQRRRESSPRTVRVSFSLRKQKKSESAKTGSENVIDTGVVACL
jgi:hypothetical protein